MIHELILENIAIEKSLISKEIIIGPQKSGKILKVYVKFAEDVRSDSHLKLLTREGEEVLNIQNSNEGSLFYPRVNIESRKYDPGSNLGGLDTDSIDYIYFVNGLLISLEKNNVEYEGIIIEKIKVIYEE